MGHSPRGIDIFQDTITISSHNQSRTSAFAIGLPPGRVYTYLYMAMKMIAVSTRRDKQVLDITGDVQDYLSETGIREGLCNIFVAHTTAAVTTGEAIEGTDEDLMETLEQIIPKIKFRHGHDPSHAPDHMISSILGARQRVLLVECNGPRPRNIILTILGE